MEANDEVEVLVAPSERVTYIAFTAPRVTDERVRQALNYAVDKQAIADSLLAGIGQPVTSVTDQITRVTASNRPTPTTRSGPGSF